MPHLYRIVNFQVNAGSCGGSLIQYQWGLESANRLPFAIGKVLVMADIRPTDVRGLHAHHATEEILVALQGGCLVDVEDGRGRMETFRLTRPEEALLLYPHVWRVMRDFEPRTILLVIADRPYDESDYIRDRTLFEACAKEWTGLGGSADRT